MSTAGKVLISLILLFSLVWIFVTSGVDQLNRNGNAQIAKLNEQIASLSEQVKKVQHDVVEYKTQTTLQDEARDHEIARLRANQSDVERTRSETAELLVEVQLELANLQDILKNAKLDDDRRVAEVENEKKEIVALENELTSLKGTNSQMLAKLNNLREQFRTSYRSNLDKINQATK